MAYHVNEDGLNHRYGVPRDTTAVPGEAESFGVMRVLELDMTFDNLPGYQSDLDGDGVADGWTGNDTPLPASSYITNAWIIVEDTFVGGTSFNIGLRKVDGTNITTTGIAGAVPVAELTTTDVYICDGDRVGGTSTVGQEDAYIRAVAVGGEFTAGKGKMVIQYISTTP